MQNKIVDVLNKYSAQADKIRKFDRRTKVVKELQKLDIELLDRRQDGCLYIKDTNSDAVYKIYFEESVSGDVKIHTILECNKNGIPVMNRINLTRV